MAKTNIKTVLLLYKVNLHAFEAHNVTTYLWAHPRLAAREEA